MNIKRKIFSEIKKYLDSNKILILRWPRQVWKTTLMKQLQDTIKNEKTVFINLDNLDLINKIKTPSDLINYLKFEYSYTKSEKLYLFLDEFQNIKQSWLFLKNIYDEYKNIKLICSGSSSLEITKNSEFLTWRKFVFDITSFNFSEYLQSKSFKNYELEFDINKNFNDLESFYLVYKNELELYFNEYLLIWWYPEVVLSSNTEERNYIIRDIVDTYIKKDITQFLKVENVLAFNNLIKLLSNQIWNLVNKTEINWIIWTWINTLNKYIDILIWTYVFSFVSPFHTNIRKEITKMQKVFCRDLWMRNYLLYGILKEFSISDIWALVENFIYNELSNKYNYSLNIYQTISKSEIDFIFSKSYNELIPIEVKYRNKVNFPNVMKTFEENYKEKINKKILFTKNLIKQENNTYYIPSCLVWFVKI